jgi:macrolide transport system ATP-binding/permease protein
VGLIRRVRALFKRDQLAADLDAELHFHLAMREQLNRDQGMLQDEARFDARRRFGNATLLKERTRDMDVVTFLETVAQDVRFAARMLAKHPGFTAVAVMALAVGIGVNTAVFTAYKAVLLQPLEAKDPGKLVNVYRTTAQIAYDPVFSYPDYEDYRDQNHVFSGLIAAAGDELALTSAPDMAGSGGSATGALIGAFGFQLPSVTSGGAQFVRSLSVSENYFSVLGVNAIRGRVFLRQDAPDLDAHPALLISENYWQRRFGGNPSLLGKNVKLNGVSFTVIGITPHDFMGTNINVPNFWIPLRLRPLLHQGRDSLRDREDNCCVLHGRLAPGVTTPEAQAAMTLIADHLRSLHAPHSDGSKPATISLTPGSNLGQPATLPHDPGLGFALLLVMGAVGLVLLIACANVASLQLARSAARQQEMGVRLSVGASRGRIIRQLLTESALLGLLSGGASLLMAWWALRFLMIGIASNLPVEWGTLALHLEPDIHVFVFVFCVSLVAGVLFGLAPALEASRSSLSSALKQEDNRFAFRLGNARLRDLLVGLQVAVCLFLLVCAGLLIRGSIRSTTLSPGYETKRTVWVSPSFPGGFGYAHPKQLAEIRQLKDRLRQLPGVVSVSSGNAPDAGGLREAAVGLNGNKPPADNSARTLFYSYVAPGHLQTVSIPLVRGRYFSEGSGDLEATVILSESAAEELWPGIDPVGKTVVLDATNQPHWKPELFPQGLSYRVIGVTRDTRGIIPGGRDAVKAYLPLPADQIDTVPMLIRTEGDPKALIAGLGKQVKAVDPNLIVYSSTLDDLLTSTPTFVMSRLSAIFATMIGGLGLLLACVGIYGTVSYAVVRRTREVGIRMALGAKKADVLGLILRESGRPVFVGLIVGILAAAGAAQLLQALLFGMSTLDPLSFAGVGALFALISMLAAYLPARRATTVDPMVALRYE